MREDEKKLAGMTEAAEHGEELLILAQRAAAQFAANNPSGLCTVDDVRDLLKRQGYSFAFGNWAGSIFRAREWEYSGSVLSRHVGSHARRISVWRLRKQGG